MGESLKSKRLLIQQLRVIEEKDPNFRRRDFWRRFSVAGFFDQTLLEDIRPLLSLHSEGHLRDLLLDLLFESPFVELLEHELRQLTLSSEMSLYTRSAACKCLAGIKSIDHFPDLMSLIEEETHVSMEVAANIIQAVGPLTFEKAVGY